MAKRIEKPHCEECGDGDALGVHTCGRDGPILTKAFFRERRGKLVKIPDEWVGQTTHPQTIRNRDSKAPDKQKRYASRETEVSGFITSPNKSRQAEILEAIEDSEEG